jgi:hypothetical protein
VLFRLHVSVGPSSQRIYYRLAQIACESGSFITEDCLSSFSNCMGEWVLANKGFTIVLIRLYVSVGPYSQKICYRLFQIACESGSFVFTYRGFIIACSDSMWVWVLTHRGFAVVLFKDCIWEWALTHRGFAIVLFRLNVSVGPSSQRIYYHLFRLHVSVGLSSQRIYYRPFLDCMWEWVLYHRGSAIVLFRFQVRVGPDSQRICYHPVQIACESGPHSQRICYRPFQIACESGSLLTEGLLSSFSDCMWEWVLRIYFQRIYYRLFR